MNNKRLTDRQTEILEHLHKQSAEPATKLLRQALDGSLPRGDIEAVCLIINDEYLMGGIKEDFEPNKYGLELEALLDTINRVRLLHS